MSDAVQISSAPPPAVSMNYAVLRERGMSLIQQWAAESWTDHNVHDPGITLLEAFSYATTELGLRLQLDVADLLRSGEAHGSADLEPAHRVLPMGPVTPQDLRRVLIDHPLVSDAQIFLPAHSEVALFERAGGGDPPLSYLSGTPSVRLGGLYEVLVELQDRELNSNTYSLQVTSAGQTYRIDLALPFWDEPEAVPFRHGATLASVAMIPVGADFWRALPESQSYYGRMTVGFTNPPAPAGSVEMWVLMRITTVLPQPGMVIAGILDAARTAVESIAAGSPLNQLQTRVSSAALAVSELQPYLASYRNLGEQAVRIGVARIQEIAIRARIEVTGGIDIESLLAEIYLDIDRMLSPRVRFESLAERRAEEADPERIFDGPLLRHGFLIEATVGVMAPTVIYTSDVLRLIMRRRGGTAADVVTQENPLGRAIVAVTDLALSNFVNNRPITVDAEDCLHLVEIERYRPRLSIAKSSIVAVRNDADVSYDSSRVQALFSALQTNDELGAMTSDPSPVWPAMRGDLLPVEDFTPMQHDLPSLFGVGEAALPDSAGPERHAAVKQLKGYLFLFEQFLGDLTAQLGNINRFFSASAAETQTYFIRPPFDLPGAPALLRRFAPNDNWSTFVANPDNPVVRALQDAAEDQERFLDRRNRMLDHLLARQGEDTVALGQELHRWGLQELAAGALPVVDQNKSIAARRQAVNARLMRIKAAFLHDAPELNAFRFLADSNPFVRDEALLRIEAVGTTFRWHLSAQGQDRLRSFDTYSSNVAAAIAAERALTFAGRSALYANEDIGGGQRRLRLRDGTTSVAQLIAESSLAFGSIGDADTALAAIAGMFATLRVESSQSPMERRVAYLTGIRSQTRHRLLTQTSLYFEIFDEPAGVGVFGKRWRLWERPGQAGQAFLNSPLRFDAATDAAATALAQESIRLVLRHGGDEWNYAIEFTAGMFVVQLRNPTGALLATSPDFASRQGAEQASNAAVEHLYRNYSAEGFHCVEHLLLRPRLNSDPFLSIPLDKETRERDPYSQRISFVFPSGYARDFSLPRETAPLTAVTPHRFRDPEFRRHVVQTIQQACPAHLLPSIFWVDSHTAATIAPASFDAFEQRFFAWLDSLLIPGDTAAAIDAARGELILALNAIANDAF